MNAPTNCPSCGSPAPHRHPAVQHEGEVQPCRDPFHLTVTPENTPERIAETQAQIDRIYSSQGDRCEEVAKVAREIAADCATDAVALDRTPFTARGMGETFGTTLAMIGALAKTVAILADEVAALKEPR